MALLEAPLKSPLSPYESLWASVTSLSIVQLTIKICANKNVLKEKIEEKKILIFGYQGSFLRLLRVT